jgi:hypothetical protein
MRAVLFTAAVALLTLASTAGIAFAEPSEAEALQRASKRGQLIYQLDRAAWVATDEMVANLSKPDLDKVQGWVVDRQGDGLRVTFYRSTGDGFAAAFIVELKDGELLSSRKVDAASPEARLSGQALTMIRAREVATTQGKTSCTNGPLNSVVLPPQNGVTSVYLLSSQVETDAFPLGGHYLFDIGATGGVIDRRAFTNTCLNVALTPNNGVTKGLYVTHFQDPTPTEIHVFLSLWAGVPIYVETRMKANAPAAKPRVWSVDGAQISWGKPLTELKNTLENEDRRKQ